ncbi:MAG: PIN domain-containing protein [Propionibacteriaceae bacterium]|jgi:predicted nucleic-acid-binding protein|nr:PIN domain-containing protein [Propionibacteriaceae bacterium]
MTASLDTNVLLRLALRDIPAQYEVARDLVVAQNSHFVVTDTAIAEVVHALMHHYHFSRGQVAAVIEAILAEPAITSNVRLITATLNQFLSQPQLSYTDCYLAEEANLGHNIPLLTFDKDLAKHHPAAQLLD